jgi:uncharacterized protein YcnI
MNKESTVTSKSLRERLTKHFAAAATATALVATTSTSSAAIIYSGAVNINIPSTTAGIYLNVVTGVSGANPASVTGWDLNPWSSSAFQLWANNSSETSNGVVVGLGSSSTLVDNLALGTVIDGTQTYGRTQNTETTGVTALTLNSSNNIFGFRFLNNATSLMNFGWVRISWGNGRSSTT